MISKDLRGGQFFIDVSCVIRRHLFNFRVKRMSTNQFLLGQKFIQIPSHDDICNLGFLLLLKIFAFLSK